MIKSEKRVELLAPAGDMEKFLTCIKFGADATYLAGKQFGLRAYAGNFSNEEIAYCCKYAHERKVKVYVTVNVFAREDDFESLPEYLIALQSAGVDAIIVSDTGVLSVARKVSPKLAIHISTQAGVTNSRAVEFYATCGAERVVLARECTLQEITAINKNTGASTEVFIHGAMCVSMSGRCLLSNYYTDRKSNYGECVQSCRWQYTAKPLLVSPVDRPSDGLEMWEDDRGSYLLNSKDLNMIRYLPEVLASGVDSLKIEGRMKSPYYVATVVNAYRRAIDDYYAGKPFNEELARDLDKASHRLYTTGFYFDEQNRQNYVSSKAVAQAEFIGVVVCACQSEKTLERCCTCESENVVVTDGELNEQSSAERGCGVYNIDTELGKGALEDSQVAKEEQKGTAQKAENDGYIVVEMRNRFNIGDELEVLSADNHFNKTFTVERIFLQTGEPTDCAKIVQHNYIVNCPFTLSKGDILRRKNR